MANGSSANTTDLTFVSTKDLIAEIAKRHDAVCVLGIRFNAANQYNVTRFQAGNRHVLLGLMSNMQSLVNNIENDQLKYNKEDNA